MRKTALQVISLLVLLSLLVVPASAQPAATSEGTTGSISLLASETGLYIVQLVDPSLAAYTGGIESLAPTSPMATGSRKVDMDSPATQGYLDYLTVQQDAFMADMDRALGRRVEVQFQYLNVLNALAVRVGQAEAVKLAALPGVKAVYPDTIRELDTDEGPYLIGADDIWNGSTTSGSPSRGEGVIIGMIDSGINHAHPSFADVGGDGYNHTNPYGIGVYKGWCVANPSFCNDKLIGAYGLNPVGATPEDTDGHGSHTASTSGGNQVDAAIPVGTDVFTFTIQGVAPHANIIAYKVCNPGCPGSASISAVNYAISDGVDVLNYSISGTDNPWVDAVDLAFLDAYAAGIFVSASAGNDGPGASTVAKTGPWNASVAASTHKRVAANSMDVTAPTPVPAGLTGLASVPGENVVLASNLTAEITYHPTSLDGCAAFPGGYFAGKIALIQRGGCTFTTKQTNAATAGAVAVAVFNNVGGPPISMGGTAATPPALMLDLVDGTAVKNYIDSSAPVTARFNAAGSVIYHQPWEDVMAGFSSRGPSQFELLKPDYTAPGVNILAAVSNLSAVQYAFYQGTSMSSPHGAGSAALMIDLHPSWSPSEVKSALAMTADPAPVLDSDGVTPADPYDMGSGRLYLSDAAIAGLVMHETHANYVAANPSLGGEPKTLNQPSMVDYDCVSSCSWTRVVSSTLNSSVGWTVTTNITSSVDLNVSPAGFTLASGASQSLTITADILSGVAGQTYFGEVVLTPNNASVAQARLPVVVVVGAAPPQIAIDPTVLESTQLPIQVTQPLTITNTGGIDLLWGLFEAGSLPTAPLVDWSDDFDSYATGSQMHGQGGWKGWDNNIAGGALTSSAQARSAPNSVAILGASDLVHEYSGYTSGFWTYTAWQYVPSGYTGQSYFILLNTYADGGPYNWSTQVMFDAATAQVVNTGTTVGTLPLITDQWVELRVEIDLVNNKQEFYYNNSLLYSGTWTEEVSGAGASNIAAVDLFANGASVVYYDDISLVERPPQACDLAGDVPWLSAQPDVGATPGGQSSVVDVSFDATGLSTGVYTATLCAASNDPLNDVVAIPVTMTVQAPVYGVQLYPAADALSGVAGAVVTYTLTLTNTGNITDTYSIAVESGWVTNLSVITEILGANSSAQFAASVSIPLSAISGDFDMAMLMVTSHGDPGVSTGATLTTTAIVPGYKIYLPVILKGFSP